MGRCGQRIGNVGVESDVWWKTGQFGMSGFLEGEKTRGGGGGWEEERDGKEGKGVVRRHIGPRSENCPPTSRQVIS